MLKKGLLSSIILFVIIISNAHAQTILEPCIGDAALKRNNACPWQTTNYGTWVYNMPATWTWFGPGCAQGDLRSVIQFNIDLSKPKKLYDNRAILNLYYPSGSTETSTFVGGATENSFIIERVTTPWSEMAVTWNTQPSTTLVESIIIPTSTQNDTSDLHHDISILVDDWICGTLPNYGIKLTMVNEGSTYRRRNYASRDFVNPVLHPTLTLEYATIAASTNGAHCDGDSIQLACSLTNAAIPGGYIFQWEHLNSATIYNGQNISNVNYIVGTNTYVVTVTNPFCQQATDTVKVIVSPIDTTTQNSTICQGDSILLGGVYQTTAGTYYDTLQSSLSCDSIVVTTLTVNSSININQNITICSGDSILLGGSYQTVAGIYNDTITMIGGCDSIISVTLTVKPSINTAQNKTICQGDSILLGGIYQNTAGIYYDTLQSYLTCDSIITTTLTINPLPIITADTNTTICSGFSANLTASGGATYSWDNGLGAGQNKTVNPLHTTTYTVTGTGANGCSNTDNVTITVIVSGTPADAGIDQEICDDILIFTLNGNTPLIAGEVGSWSIQYGTGILTDPLMPNTTGSELSIGLNVFEWTITSPICPATTDYVTLNVKDCTPIGIYIPNAFTANKDGLNDGFFAMGYGIKEINTMVFDRWGELIFESNKLGQPWYGDYKGSLVQEGVYSYKIRALDVFNKWHEYVGKVTLLK